MAEPELGRAIFTQYLKALMRCILHRPNRDAAINWSLCSGSRDRNCNAVCDRDGIAIARQLATVKTGGLLIFRTTEHCYVRFHLCFGRCASETRALVADVLQSEAQQKFKTPP